MILHLNFTRVNTLHFLAPTELDNDDLTIIKDCQQFDVRQKEEWMEIMTGYETNNKYDILSHADKQLIFKALENTSAWNRVRYGRKRPYVVGLWDRNGDEQLVMKSSIEPDGKKIRVEIPPGNFVAKISEEMVYLRPSFFVRNAEGQLMYKITSPLSASTGSLKNVNFEIYCNDEKTNIGHITKKWSGFMREYYTDADFFELVVPQDLSVEWKMVLLAATLTVDFEFYEKRTRGIFMRFFWWWP